MEISPKWKDGGFRRKIYRLQSGKCCYCSKEMTLPKSKSPNAESSCATVEHLRPVSEGGSDKLNNLAIACRKCNELRGASGANWLEFATIIEELRDYGY